jgi:aldehyde:ferredoxin oxidoreductase
MKWNPTIDDDIPSRFYEPLPTGPYKGKAADRTNVKQKIEKYYEQAGWDKDGIPTKETLRRLNLDDVDEALEFVHK